MTKEEKKLLLNDLCVRLPYGVKVLIEYDLFYDEREPYAAVLTAELLVHLLTDDFSVKPFLRSISSLDEKEIEQIFGKAKPYIIEAIKESESEMPNRFIEITNDFMADSVIVDELNKRHIDFRGFIDKDLALAAPEDMYKF